MNLRNPVVPILWFAFIAATMAFLTPPFEAPDEPSHLNYVNFISSRLALPNQLDPDAQVQGEGAQPPLYYAACGVIVRLLLEDNQIDYNLTPDPTSSRWGGIRGSGSLYLHSGVDFHTTSDQAVFYLLRLFTLLLSIPTLWVIWKILCELIDERDVRLLGLFFAATLPQFAFISGVVNSDSAALLFGALSILYALRMYRRPDEWKFHALGGAFFGLGLSVKLFGIVFLPMIAITYLLAAFEGRTPCRRLAAMAGIFFVCALAAGAFHYVRAAILYGDPMMSDVVNAANTLTNVAKSPFTLGFWLPMAHIVFRSFVATFGWMNNSLHPSLYLVHIAVAILTAFGLWKSLGALRRSAIWLIPLTALVGNVIGALYWYWRFDQTQGRYYLPSLPVIALAVAVGLGWATAKLRLGRDLNFTRRAIAGAFAAVELTSLFYLGAIA